MFEEEAVSFNEYRYAVADRASTSMNRLSNTLERAPSVSPDRRRARSISPSGRKSPRVWEQSRVTEHSDYTYGAAVQRLRSTLNDYERHERGAKMVQFSPRSRSVPASSYGGNLYAPRVPPSGTDIPSPQEMIPLLQNQTALVAQLQASSNYSNEELQVLKLKVKELSEENRLLHEELKHSVIQEILNEGLDVPGIPKSFPFASSLETPPPTGQKSQQPDPSQAMSRQDYGRWQRELERITALHTAKASRLETQLSHSREELEKSERFIGELEGRLRMVESLKDMTQDGMVALSTGVCIRCGQSEALLPPNVLASQKQSLEKITIERDSILEQLSTVRAQYTALKQREEEAYEQVKGSVLLVEQAQMELTQALVQREQLREELENMKQRMKQHVEEMTHKMGEEREIVRAETKAEREEMNMKIKEITESLVEAQNQLEKLTREKVALLAELDEARQQIDMYGLDYGKATDNMKMSMTQATMERNAAIQNLSRLKQELMQTERDKDQGKDRMKTEVSGLRRRLDQAEKELVDSKEECIQLTNTLQSLEREVHLAKLAKESIERNRSDDVKQVMRRAEKREQDLNCLIDQLEQRNTQVTGELEDLVNSQGTLVHKLRGECKKLAVQLEDQTHKYKRDNKKLKAANEGLRGRLDRAQRRLRELEDQHVQQGHLQEQMRQRLKQMDNHAISSGGQIIELLSKESGLMRDRQILAREVEFLRQQLAANGVDRGRFYSSHTPVVNDILSTVKMEQEDRRHGRQEGETGATAQGGKDKVTWAKQEQQRDSPEEVESLEED